MWCSKHYEAGFGSTNGLFEFRREVRIVLDHVIEPFADLKKLGLRYVAQFGFHLLDFTHEVIMQSACRECKKPGKERDLRSPDYFDRRLRKRRSLMLALGWNERVVRSREVNAMLRSSSRQMPVSSLTRRFRLRCRR